MTTTPPLPGTNTQFDWREAIKAARNNTGEFTYDELLERASSWDTCPCGFAGTALSRDANGRPTSDRLAKFGLEFSECVYMKAWTLALQALDQIEERIAEITEDQP